MAEWAYMRLVWRNHRAFALFSMAFITLFQFLILYLVTTFDTMAIITALMAQLPESMQAFLHDSFFSMLTYDGAAAFGFNHPLVLSLLVITAVNIPVHHITREFDSGTLELLLAHPLKRTTLLASLWLAGSLILLIIIAAALIGSVSSILIFHHLTIPVLARISGIAFNLWLLVLLIFSYTLLIAVYGKVGGKAGNASAVITLVFYLLYVVSEIWKDIRFIRPVNIFYYYEPQKVMAGQGNLLLDMAVLFLLIGFCTGLAFRQFHRRDIP